MIDTFKEINTLERIDQIFRGVDPFKVVKSVNPVVSILSRAFDNLFEGVDSFGKDDAFEVIDTLRIDTFEDGNPLPTPLK